MSLTSRVLTNYSLVALLLAIPVANHCPGQEPSENSEAIPVVVEKIGSQISVNLPTLIEGAAVKLRLKITNKTDCDVSEMQGKRTANYYSTKFSKDQVAAGETVDLELLITPPRHKIAEQIELVGLIEDDQHSRQVSFVKIDLQGSAQRPIRVSPDFVNINQWPEELFIALILASPEIKITDVSQIKLTSKQLEIAEVLQEEWGYKVKLKKAEGAELPKGEFLAMMTASFTTPGSAEMQMEEVIRFTTNPRIDVSTPLVRLVGSGEGVKHVELRGKVAMKDHTGAEMSLTTNDFMASLVSVVDNRVIMIDPDVADVGRQVGDSNVYHMEIFTTIFSGTIPEENWHLIFYGKRDTVDLSGTWEEISNKHTCVPAEWVRNIK